MPVIDPKTNFPSDFEPGIYLAVVKGCDEKKSKKNGTPYFNLRLHDDETGELLCWDTAMLDGNGKGIGIAKLKALGFFQSDEPERVDAEDVIGRRAWVRVAWDTYEGKTRLKVETRMEPDFDLGYWPEGEMPPEAADPLAPVSQVPDAGSTKDPVKDLDTPF